MSSWASPAIPLGRTDVRTGFRTASPAFSTTRNCFRWYFPASWRKWNPTSCPAPDDSGIVSLDFCKNASAIHHLDPIDYIVLREWDAQGNFAGASLLLGRFSRGTFVQRADRIPILREKIRMDSARTAEPSRIRTSTAN